ncbi:putative transcription factor bHLH041 [Curcuma longa]|uniref:putative transcription factor bHLH041 n=1 Tax=Curcuma longa TaxID=136217 RepID=UPI003D9DB3E7
MDGWCRNVGGDLSYSASALGSSAGPFIYSQEPGQFIYQISQKMEHPGWEGIFPCKQMKNQQQGVKFPADRDEAAIMKAMLAVMSSTTTTPSSSAVSSPSTMSHPAGEVFGEQNNSSMRAFTPYNPVLAPKLELKEISLSGQKMIKGSICFLRRIKCDREREEGMKTTTWPAPATSNQLHHVISERRRREKLNDSFHRLSMVLPPDSKRDKASVLISARNYMKTLRAQIMDLQEKNRKLEAHLPMDEMMAEGNFQVEVMKLGSDEPRSQLEQIHIKITVRVECDIVNLILHVLECLRGMRIVSIVSVDARAYSPQMRISARANLKLQIKSCDWNEALFQEAMNRAINGVAPPAEVLLAV